MRSDFVLLGLLVLVPSCTPSGSPRDSASTTASAAVTTALPAPSAVAPGRSRLADLAPVHPAAKRGACPLTIEPGVGIGGVELGYTMRDLEALGLPIAQEDRSTVVTVGAMKASLLQGKVVDVWIDDVRRVDDCIALGGKAIGRSAPYEAFRERVSKCVAEAPREGGSFERCEGGGLFLGRGMGTFLQIRVRPKGDDLTLDNLAVALEDDGSSVALDPKVRARLLETCLDRRELAGYWHADKPGRGTLKIVKTDLVPGTPSFKMFGSPVEWVERGAKGESYVEVRGFSATRSKLTLSLAYPIDGVVAVATFRPAGTDWTLEQLSVSER